MASKKDFMGNLKRDELKRAAERKPEDLQAVVSENIEVAAGKEEKPKKKVGRPKKKTEPTKNINIAVPVSTLEKIEIVKNAVYDGNLTEYINALISADLEENFDAYKAEYDRRKSLKKH